MRLINIETLKLEDFIGSSQDVPPYAILSHRWAKDEISYQDFIRQPWPDSQGSRKVAQFCEFVKQHKDHHVHWAWIDTCCIDKRSSAELSEAINSMYNWYKDAVYCVAYLADVSGSMASESCRSQFAASEWFTRGWTLQELLAPARVIFCCQGWKVIGQKVDKSIMDIVSRTTGIERDYLKSTKALGHACIAVKMSWMANRITTREEDMAYAMLGLLDVNMSLLYGEGGVNAFRRVQMKLIAQSSDESIFAWGNGEEASYESVTSTRPVLAASPSDFAGCGSLSQMKNAGLRRIISREPYYTTNRGIKFGGCAVPLGDGSERYQLTKVASSGSCGQWWESVRNDAYLVPLNCWDLNFSTNLFGEPRRCHIVVTDAKPSITMGKFHAAKKTEGFHRLLWTTLDPPIKEKITYWTPYDKVYQFYLAYRQEMAGGGLGLTIGTSTSDWFVHRA